MSIKTDLRGYISKKQQLERECDILRELNATIVYGQTAFKDMPGTKSWNKDKLGKASSRLLDLQRKHTKTFEELVDEIVTLDNWYAELPESIYKTALYYRFYKGMSWVPIQHKLGNNKTADALRVGVNHLIATQSHRYPK